MAADLPEAELLDEPTTADLGAKVTEAWREFARALAAALPELPVGSPSRSDPRPDRLGHRQRGLRRERGTHRGGRLQRSR